MILSLWCALFVVLVAGAGTSVRVMGQTGAESTPSARAIPDVPVPLLPPESFDDGHGYAVPGMGWKHVPPESEGFCPARLDALQALLKTHQIGAMMIVSRGKVIFEYGDTTLVSKVASVRKSVLDLMFAVEAKHGLMLDSALTKNMIGAWI